MFIRHFTFTRETTVFIPGCVAMDRLGSARSSTICGQPLRFFLGAFLAVFRFGACVDFSDFFAKANSQPCAYFFVEPIRRIDMVILSALRTPGMLHSWDKPASLRTHGDPPVDVCGSVRNVPGGTNSFQPGRGTDAPRLQLALSEHPTAECSLCVTPTCSQGQEPPPFGGSKGPHLAYRWSRLYLNRCGSH